MYCSRTIVVYHTQLNADTRSPVASLRLMDKHTGVEGGEGLFLLASVTME